MRVFVQPVVLDLPRAVIAQPIGEHRLFDAVVEQLPLGGARRPRDLHFEKDGELHARLLSTANQRDRRAATRPGRSRRAVALRKLATSACSTIAASASPS